VNNQLKHEENRGWSVRDLTAQYAYENPSWTREQCEEKAKIIYKELNAMNIESVRNDKKYYDHNMSREVSGNSRGYLRYRDTEDEDMIDV
jgi:hypothetical protein